MHVFVKIGQFLLIIEVIVMDDFLHEILESTKKMFPGATSVNIVVTNEEVKVSASYHGELSATSMRKVDGTWCSKRK